MFERLAELLREHSDLAQLGKPQTAAAVSEAEVRLGVVFSASFREYLQRWGAISFGPNEYTGLGTSIRNVVSVTERSRARGLQAHLVVLCDHDGDEYDCLDTSVRLAEECPVIRWDIVTRSASWQRSATFETYITDDVEAFL